MESSLEILRVFSVRSNIVSKLLFSESGAEIQCLSFTFSKSSTSLVA